ncbi:MAG: hypothetical protein ACRDGA_06210 [Bacteroidota bacterium]
MKYLRLWDKFTVLLFALYLSGCEPVNDPLEDNSEPPALPTVTFKSLPDTTHLEAKYTQSTIDAMNGFSFAYFSTFINVTPTKTQDGFTWTRTLQNLTIRLVAAKQLNEGYTWKIIYNGSDSQGRTYNNWTLLDGTTTVDSKNATWIVYEDNTTVKTADFEWSTSSTGVLTGTFKLYTGSAVATQIVLTSNPDNSGELKLYDGTVIVYRSLWQANGSGQWWRYDSSGQITSSGSW